MWKLLSLNFTFLIALIGITQSNKAEKEESGWLGLRPIGLLLVLFTIIAFGATIFQELADQDRSTEDRRNLESVNEALVSMQLQLERMASKDPTAKDLVNQLAGAKVNVAPPEDLVFIYTSTFFSGQRQLAQDDANILRKRLKEMRKPYEVFVYERRDQTRWAVVVGEPIPKSAAFATLKEFNKLTSINAYANLAQNWTKL